MRYWEESDPSALIPAEGRLRKEGPPPSSASKDASPSRELRLNCRKRKSACILIKRVYKLTCSSEESPNDSDISLSREFDRCRSGFEVGEFDEGEMRKDSR